MDRCKDNSRCPIDFSLDWLWILRATVIDCQASDWRGGNLTDLGHRLWQGLKYRGRNQTQSEQGKEQVMSVISHFSPLWC